MAKKSLILSGIFFISVILIFGCTKKPPVSPNTVNTSTFTAVITRTALPQATVSSTFNPAAALSYTATHTAIPVETGMGTATVTATRTLVYTMTNTITNTSTQEDTYTPSVTCTITETTTFTPTATATIKPVDLMFVVDCTGDMTAALTSLRTTFSTTFVPNLMMKLGGSAADIRYGLEEFRDIYGTGTLEKQKNYGFAANVPSMQTWLNGLSAGDGDDYPETSLEALVDGYGNTGIAVWRPGAVKVMMLITGAAFKSTECGTGPLSITDTAQTLYTQGVRIEAISPDVGAADPQYSACSPKELPGFAGGIWVECISQSSLSTYMLEIADDIAK
jgi:hypothetical protein